MVLVQNLAVLGFPPRDDDWWFLPDLMEGRGLERVWREFSPTGAYFYRPMRAVLFYLWWEAGGDSRYFYLCTLLLHGVTACSVVWLARRLGASVVAAWCAGFLYASAAPIHSYSLSWHVGVNDVAAALLSILAIGWGVTGGTLAALAACFVALLFKESAIIVPFVIVAGRWLLDRRPYLRGWQGFALLLGAYGTLKVVQLRGDWDPVMRELYTMSASPRVLTRNGLYYLRLLLTPWWPDLLPAGRAGLLGTAALGGAALALAFRPARRDRATAHADLRLSVLLVGWVVLAITLVAPLPVLQSQWFLVPALAPGALLAALAVERLATVAAQPWLKPSVVLGSFTFLLLCAGTANAYRATQVPLPDRYSPGDTDPVVLGRIASVLRDDLRPALGREPVERVLLQGIAGTQSWLPRALPVWTERPSLDVRDLDAMTPCSAGCCLEPEGVPVDPSRTFVVHLCGSSVCAWRLDGLVDSTCNYTLERWESHLPGAILGFRGEGGALFEGFHPVEHGLRWTRGLRAVVWFRLDGGLEPRRAARLELSGRSLGNQRIRVLLNGRPLGSRSITDTSTTMQFVVPPEGLRAVGANQLVLETPDARPVGADRRALGFAFQWARIRSDDPAGK